MNKRTVSLLGISALLTFSFPVLAEEHVHGTEETKDAKHADEKADKKPGRKKRQLMCKECGKPEKNCECKGEGHREGDGHADHPTH